MKFTVACLQTSAGDGLEKNLSVIARLLDDAQAAGASLALLPENAFLMQAMGVSNPAYNFLQEEHPGILLCQKAAKEKKMWIVIGSVAVQPDEFGRKANRSLVIDDTGAIVSSYDKIHLFDADFATGESYAESARFFPGTSAQLVSTPWGKLGLSICYDIRFPHLFRQLAKKGAIFLSTPAAFTAFTGEAHWHVLQRARAIENGCYVFAPGQCGIHPGDRKTFGHSMIVDPWGTIIAEAGEEVGIITAEVDTDRVEHIRRILPSLQHDREFELQDYSI